MEGGVSGGGVGWAAAVDGLAKARVALALKSATNRRQQDVVKNIRSEVSMCGENVTSLGFYTVFGVDGKCELFIQDPLPIVCVR